MANDNTNNNIPPIADESGVVKVWNFKQNPDGSLTPASSGGVASAVDISDSSGNPLNSNGSGALNVAVVSGGGSNASVGTNGAAAPASSTQAGGSDGTNLQPLQVDASKNLKTIVNAPLPAGTNQIGHVITDTGSTTVVTGTTTVAGVVSQVAVPAAVTPATQNITTQDLASTSGTGFDSQPIITGSPTAGSAASFALSNFNTVRVQVSGTWTGTLQSEFSMDGGTTWYISAVHLNGTSFTATTFTANFQGASSAAGTTNYRLRATAAITGTAVVTITESVSCVAVNVITPIRLQDTTTQSIGGTIKAASTAAVATDTALVVAVSPNNAVSTTGAASAETTAAWTNATTINTALTQTITGYSTVVVTFNQTTTVTGGAVTFEVSDANTNWYTVLAERVGQTAVGPSGTYTLQANNNASFQISVAGFVGFRVRLSTLMTGTGTINVGVQAQSNPFTPISSPPVLIETNTAASNLADNQANGNFITSNTNATAPLGVGSWMYGGAFGGAANAALSGWSKARTPTVFKTSQITSSAGTGNTAVWTPGSGNKFRLLKVFVQVSDNASVAAGAVVSIQLVDSASNMPIVFDVFIPTTAVTTVIGDGLEQQLDLGDFGILSAAANNVLNVALTTALATGSVRIICMGTEE